MLDHISKSLDSDHWLTIFIVHVLVPDFYVWVPKQELMSRPKGGDRKERTIAINQNIEHATEVIVDDVSSSRMFTGDVGSYMYVQ